MENITIGMGLFQEILTLAERGSKINAIKKLRSQHKLGLKEAKHAVEKLMNERGLADCPGPYVAQIVCGPRIKRLILDFGEGEIEVDLETMQMMTLMKLEKIGLDACRDILELVDALQGFSDGHHIKAIKEGVSESKD